MTKAARAFEAAKAADDERERKRAEMYDAVRRIYGDAELAADQVLEDAAAAVQRAGRNRKAARDQVAKARRPNIERAAVDVVDPVDEKRTVRVEMRVPSAVLRLHGMGAIDARELRAAGWLKAVFEMGAAGGTSAIDYAVERVDTSLSVREPISGHTIDAIRTLDQVRRAVGNTSFLVLRRALVDGLSITDIARQWPSVIRDQAGEPDRDTRKFVGRLFREALADVAELFCRGLDGLSTKGRRAAR